MTDHGVPATPSRSPLHALVAQSTTPANALPPGPTPGPWAWKHGRLVAVREETPLSEYYGDNDVLSTMGGVPVFGRAADKALIKAAPDLLAALQRVQEAYCGVGDLEGTGTNMAAAMPDVDAAIASARELKA